MTNLACHTTGSINVSALLAAGIQPGQNDELWWTLWLSEKSEGTSLHNGDDSPGQKRRHEPEPWESHMHNKNSRARRFYDKAREKRHFNH